MWPSPLSPYDPPFRQPLSKASKGPFCPQQGSGAAALAVDGLAATGASGASANPGPGAADVNPNAIITRTYSNWDGSIPYVPVAANLTATSGGGTNRSIDQNLKGPYVDEITTGFDMGLNRTMTVQFNYVYKKDGNGNKSINTALPYDAYTVQTTGVDPGPDNKVGTADDQTLTVYSVPRTYPGFGQNVERIVQAEGNNRYHAFGVTFNKQYANNWSFLFSFDRDYRDLRDNAPRNPNEALYGPGTTTGTNYGVQNFQFARKSWNHAMRAATGKYFLPFKSIRWADGSKSEDCGFIMFASSSSVQGCSWMRVVLPSNSTTQ